MILSALHIKFYFFCKVKLWFWLRNVDVDCKKNFAQEGLLLEQEHLREKKNENKQVRIGSIVVDYIDFNNKIVYEIKKSIIGKESAIWQLKYYLYILGKPYTGVLEIPGIEKIEVTLNNLDIKTIEKVIMEIEKMKNKPCPPITKEKKCTTCQMSNFCHA